MLMAGTRRAGWFFQFILLLIGFIHLSCTVRTPAEQKATTVPPILQQSWSKYVDRFIQRDGRVIDHKEGGISTSEGQAYAMLRAVWMGDRSTFDKTYEWGVNNLNSKIRSDSLWAWKWGKDDKGNWRVLDSAFATDADQDVALALILAWKAWNDSRYLTQAQIVMTDLWNIGSIQVGGRRYLLAGDTLCTADTCRLNPSYAAPYAYRIFARFDTARDWNDLVDTSYFLLESASKLTTTRLPPDWLILHLDDGRLSSGDAKDNSFSYDAFRVFWRVALDRILFNDARATRYLNDSTDWLIREWKTKKKLPAVISARGENVSKYESLEMLAGLAPALGFLSQDVAEAMYKRIDSRYSGGLWAETDSYYIQNWVWFGTALRNSYIAPFERVRY